MADLKAALASIAQLETEVNSLSGGALNPIQELGIELEEKRYAARFDALTDPAKYKTARDAAFNELKNAVTQSYATAYKAFRTAGHPVESAKQMALAAAEGERRVQSAILESQFPAAANDIGLAAASARSGKFPGHISGATSRSSHPAIRRKRAKARKRR